MYSRLLGWSVENFMSIEKGSVEFDERNIINFKGYNDSGKSAMLTALKVLMTNSDPTKQVNFIQDDKEYFRVIAYFGDGVQILRDKYINGQSLYEMYKDGEVIFSTKQGRALTKVSDVPEPIAIYLGLISYDGVCLNCRSCFEKQIGVQTSGSENYKMFNAVLKSEEIATAGALLNNDRNKLASDISAVDSELTYMKSIYRSDLSGELVEELKRRDAVLDLYESRTSRLSGINNILSAIDVVKVAPEVSAVESRQLQALSEIQSIVKSLSGVVVVPEVPEVADKQLSMLSQISDYVSALENCNVAPEVGSVDASQLSMLSTIWGIHVILMECDDALSNVDSEMTKLQDELISLQSQLQDYGVKMIKCPGCGQVFSENECHVHNG